MKRSVVISISEPNIDLWETARHQAAQEDRPLVRLVNQAVREYLQRRRVMVVRGEGASNGVPTAQG